MEPVYKLLAVDDNELNLGLFRLFLTQLGHQVTSVNNPFDAIELVSQHQFDMVFTDIQMPRMSGIEAAAKMRKDGYKEPIIAITAHLSNVEEDKLAASNVNGFLIKPVSKQDLINILREHLGGQPGHSGALQIEEPAPPHHSHDSHDSQDSNHSNDTQSKTESIYDLDVALERANQSSELATEMMHLLVESLEGALPIIGPENSDALSEQLHKLSGGVRYTGAIKLETTLDTKRRQILENNLEDFEAIETEIRRVIEWVKANPTPFKLD